MYLSPSVSDNLRIVYGITNLLSDLGGIMNIMICIFGIIFKPVSKFLYYTNTIKGLFLARTKDSKLFIPAKDGHKMSLTER